MQQPRLTILYLVKLLFVLLYLQSNSIVECKVKCVSYGKCGCKLDNGGGIIDLSPMMTGQSPMCVYILFIMNLIYFFITLVHGLVNSLAHYRRTL